ncbi:XRE family transcriptional regulator [Neisseria weixii]|uniref:XRE family transcriptional regulator n=1 Tax=Neisseria weixii TaxID=1853276 RepID=A0A3N4N731_9NEIS|nr:helix-turn-helix transcriptional regulator [Neisseria weixii]RPD90908.1 XRE family transcriptional regulator [Neisseria weixii]RPD91102.1 XRE family transcriptional regulator [Neisseria weixii]
MNARDQLRQNIRDLREDKHMTQAVMAEKLGMSERVMQKLNVASQEFELDVYSKLHKCLK